MNEQEQWYEWEQGRARCPYCIGLDMDDFEATCDCSRFSLETTGQPIVIQVVGVPESRTVVLPDRIVKPHDPQCATLNRALDPGPEGEGHFDERGWYYGTCDCRP